MKVRLYKCITCGTNHLTQNAAENCKHILVIGKTPLGLNKVLDMRKK